MRAPRKTPLRNSAGAVIRIEAALRNLSPEFSVAFFGDMLESVISSAMVNGSCIVPGIGTFKRTEYKARRRHNPRTGSLDLIPGGEKVVFQANKPPRSSSKQQGQLVQPAKKRAHQS
jgi:nucleoid DNA-binding protein